MVSLVRKGVVMRLTDGVLQQSSQHLLALWRSLEEHLCHGGEQLQLNSCGGFI